MPDIEVAWSREISTSPITATPLITDLDADGELDIITVSFSGDIQVVNAGDGMTLKGWPHRLSHTSVHASPIQHDFNGDGMLDILVTTADGSLYTFSHDGSLMSDRSYQLDGLYIKRDWWLQQLTADEESIHEYILDLPPVSAEQGIGYMRVDPHVLATPVLADLNNDDVVEELVIAVSYYYDLEQYSEGDAIENLGRNLTLDNLENFLASTLLLFNITSMQPIRSIHLELTKVDAEYPGYLLFTPTVVDLDGVGGPLEIVVATSAGNLRVYDCEGQSRPGFPVPTDSLHGQVAVEDVDGDGRVELLVGDTGGNLGCYTADGQVKWETQVSGSSPAGIRLADTTGDGRLDVVFGGNDGQLWVLDAATGKVLDGWPFRIFRSLQAVPLIFTAPGPSSPVLASIGPDGQLHIIAMDRSCRRHHKIAPKTSLVPMLSHDLLPSNPGLELLAATEEGVLLCLSVRQKEASPVDGDQLALHAWPSETKGINDFTFGKYGLLLYNWPEGVAEISAHSFTLTLIIHDELHNASSSHGLYQVRVYVGNELLHARMFSAPGAYSLDVPSPVQPKQGHLVVHCTNRFGKLATRILPVRFHMSALGQLQWLLVAPTLAMVLTLLFLHGFPHKDILPVAHSKNT